MAKQPGWVLVFTDGRGYHVLHRNVYKSGMGLFIAYYFSKPRADKHAKLANENGISPCTKGVA